MCFFTTLIEPESFLSCGKYTLIDKHWIVSIVNDGQFTEGLMYIWTKLVSPLRCMRFPYVSLNQCIVSTEDTKFITDIR